MRRGHATRIVQRFLRRALLIRYLKGAKRIFNTLITIFLSNCFHLQIPDLFLSSSLPYPPFKSTIVNGKTSNKGILIRQTISDLFSWIFFHFINLCQLTSKDMLFSTRILDRYKPRFLSVLLNVFVSCIEHEYGC